MGLKESFDNREKTECLHCDTLTMITLEITFISGRPKEKRLAVLKAVNDGVVAAAGISPDDLLITLYETPEAQSSPPAHRGARVIGADALRILPISQELSDGQEPH